MEVQCSECDILVNKVPSQCKSVNHFCSRSCAAKFNMRKRKIILFCLRCNQELDNKTQKQFCSISCAALQQSDQKVISGNASVKALKRFLLAKRGHQCEVCKNTEWQDQPIPLDMDHINGNSTNNDMTNLRLICPNCHAQTPTYKNKNKGNGRAYRRKRYAEGKSY